ncbi:MULTISPECIES: 5,6-dimethylbenzimidazole synthase [Spongiibacter]|uniref:5,6-dimethylbenzimidazole synthase n=1 Tax=Spongiibacter TaxID=630749 RepID=UPI000C5B85C4|nr:MULTISPECIES: 5,6-dimethylbenzimidazole synthase [Spongiibacter]MAY38413.1 5,6-dimethylbenzimidazole synthase [Spongiibacter sp.]MBI59099.1 5,6-dimethylbenzimidazole synthase [Spongiibacter sp.]|tara:strand:+ start:7513 stop:8154 length:642 start_codon:yes stop_codon:yes gene_type:complete
MNSEFSPADIDAIYRVIAARRDMRHFAGGDVAPETLRRLLAAAHQAPSVGFMQPWRFIRIRRPALRDALYEAVQREITASAEALGDRKQEFLRLKVEGVRDCAELLVVALCDHRERYIFGRRTLPEMDLASAACAIQNLWLAARAEGLGMGWVSLFQPEEIKPLLKMPEDSHPIALLCLGPVHEFYDKPMLEQENWDSRRPLDSLIMEDGWHD